MPVWTGWHGEGAVRCAGALPGVLGARAPGARHRRGLPCRFRGCAQEVEARVQMIAPAAAGFPRHPGQGFQGLSMNPNRAAAGCMLSAAACRRCARWPGCVGCLAQTVCRTRSLRSGRAGQRCLDPCSHLSVCADKITRGWRARACRRGGATNTARGGRGDFGGTKGLRCLRDSALPRPLQSLQHPGRT